MAGPKFIPKDGQLDYTNIRYCPVINTVVMFNGKVLLVKRSKELRLYPGYWNGISGFLDDGQSIEEKAIEELGEELDIAAKQIIQLRRGKPFIQEAPEYAKTWLVVPILVEINTDKFTLNQEAQTAKWFNPTEISLQYLLPGFNEVLTSLSKLIQ